MLAIFGKDNIMSGEYYPNLVTVIINKSTYGLIIIPAVKKFQVHNYRFATRYKCHRLSIFRLQLTEIYVRISFEVPNGPRG